MSSDSSKSRKSQLERLDPEAFAAWVRAGEEIEKLRASVETLNNRGRKASKQTAKRNQQVFAKNCREILRQSFPWLKPNALIELVEHFRQPGPYGMDRLEKLLQIRWVQSHPDEVEESLKNRIDLTDLAGYLKEKRDELNFGSIELPRAIEAIEDVQRWLDLQGYDYPAWPTPTTRMEARNLLNEFRRFIAGLTKPKAREKGGKADGRAGLMPDSKAMTNDQVKKRQPLQRHHWQVYFALKYAESKMERQLWAWESLKYWRDNGFDEQDSETKGAEYLREFDPAAYSEKSFREILSHARNHPQINDPRNEKRKGNTKGQKRRNRRKMTDPDEKGVAE